jgi:DNA-binding protein HU-beta
MGRAGHAAGGRSRRRGGERQDACPLTKPQVVALQQTKAGPCARLFCEKSPDFQGFYRFYRLVAGAVLSKVRFLPDESFVPVFSWKGSFMNKNELVSAVADAAKISKGDAQSAVDAVFSVITGELKKGGDVRLVGFGNFTVSKRAASTGRNPQTGAAVKIPARTVPKFSAGKGLKDAVN